MIVETPEEVFYLEDLGSAFSEINIADKVLVLRVFRTKEEAGVAKDVLNVFFGIQAVVTSDPLVDILHSANAAEDNIRVVLSEYDANGDLFDAETLLEPHRSVN